MFDHTHYVPILRWKQAEWLALRRLSPTNKQRITPLIEITPITGPPRKRTPTLADKLQSNALDIAKNWGIQPIFVDPWHLQGSRCGNSHPLEYLAHHAKNCGVSLIPVTGLCRPHDYQSAVIALVSTDHLGVCVRLCREDVDNPKLQDMLDDLLTTLSVSDADVDLLVDLQVFDPNCQNYYRLCSRLPMLGAWRTFTVAAGAFPLDLTCFTPGQHFHPRNEWLLWQRAVLRDGLFSRKPTYSDYTIQYGSYREPPLRSNPSASIRYTCGNDWLIMRGEGLYHDGSPGHDQWPASAQLLCQLQEFCGRGFSYGDDYIYQISLQTTTTGSSMSWLSAGVNHHITFVVQQLASLVVP